MTCHASDSGQSHQGILVGCNDGTVREMGSTGPETPTAIVLTGAIGGKGYQHTCAFTIEYQSSEEITLTPIVADEGNGSYAPNPVTLPSTGGQITKYRSGFSANKWKLMQFQFTFTDPTALIFLQGMVVNVKNWGSDEEYRPVVIFGESVGGLGGEQ